MVAAALLLITGLVLLGVVLVRKNVELASAVGSVLATVLAVVGA